MLIGSRILTASAIALAGASLLAASAQAQTAQQPRHHYGRVAYRHVAQHHVAVREGRAAAQAGAVVVRTGRSYLDPGPTAPIGTENRYFYDTAQSFNLHDEGPDFTRDIGGFEMLPDRFGPRW